MTSTTPTERLLARTAKDWLDDPSPEAEERRVGADQAVTHYLSFEERDKREIARQRSVK